MKTLRTFFVVLAILLCLAPLSAQSESDQFMTIKIHGGYNSWILGTAALSSSNSGATAGSWSFGLDLLFMDPQKVQIGVEAAYLPMVALGSGTTGFVLRMIPITADVVINSGVFYADIGLGAAFMNVNAGTTSPLGTDYSLTAPSPAFLVKAGMGFNFRIVEWFGLDIGATLYMPLSDFGLTKQQNVSPFLWALLFSQLDIRAGVNFNL